MRRGESLIILSSTSRTTAVVFVRACAKPLYRWYPVGIRIFWVDFLVRRSKMAAEKIFLIREDNKLKSGGRCDVLGGSKIHNLQYLAAQKNRKLFRYYGFVRIGRQNYHLRKFKILEDYPPFPMFCSSQMPARRTICLGGGRVVRGVLLHVSLLRPSAPCSTEVSTLTDSPQCRHQWQYPMVVYAIYAFFWASV